MLVESICIVGGGSSGWMTAALLSKDHPDKEICLIESDNIPTIGVGESTLAHFNRFLLRLDLKDEDWMSECNATYKTSIAFKNFKDGKGERFHYPFGDFEQDALVMRFFELQCRYGTDMYPTDEFATFVNKQTYLANYNKMVDEIPNCGYRKQWDTSYHLNADLFGIYLRDKIAIPNGVHHLKGDVNNIIRTPEGDISAITTIDGQCISADLFIDCTGFRSLLLEQHMGVEFYPFNDMLFNDRALATHIDYKDKETQMDCYTDCVAMNSGWVYNIPMWNNIGTGYVYSSKYISDVDAEKEFREYLNDQECPLMPIKIKHGRHAVGWERNCVAIGLSYGFLEPLESTGLMTTHENLIVLSDILDQRGGIVTKHDRDVYNNTTEKVIESMKNFVAMHYSLSSRDDTPYWKDATETIPFEKHWNSVNEATLVALNDYRCFMDAMEKANWDTNEMGEGSIYIAAAMGIRPISKALFKEKVTEERMNDIEETHKLYQQDKKFMLDWIYKQPSHYQYLQDHIYV